MNAARTASSPQEMVAWACRILAMHGHGDLTLGHVSARAGGHLFMKRKGLGLEEVTPADVLTLDLQGRRIAGNGMVHLEAPLHTEIYRARSDVGAVIHTHPLYATAFGTVEAGLEYLSHDALLFPDGLGIFDDTADLIITRENGAAIARALGPHRAVLLRNHGVLVAGKDVRWAVLQALTLERALKLQAVARGLGEPRPIADELVAALHTSKYRDEFLEEYWAYWVRGVRRAGLARGMSSERAQAAGSRAHARGPAAQRTRRRGG